MKQFRWTIDSDPVPGWMLTQPWLSEEGLPNRGILDITYYSGEGIHKNGCVPVTKFRKSLLYLVSHLFLFVCFYLPSTINYPYFDYFLDTFG